MWPISNKKIGISPAVSVQLEG